MTHQEVILLQDNICFSIRYSSRHGNNEEIQN